MTRFLIALGIVCLFVYGFARALRMAMAAYGSGE